MAEKNYKQLNIKKFPKSAISDTPENKFWKKFDIAFDKTYSQAISKVNISNNKKNLIAYTDGRCVDIYSIKKQNITKQFDKFKTNITGLSFRKDGALLAVGEQSGSIKIFDIKRKYQLRQFKNHKKAVSALCFSDIDSFLFSGSDDLSIKQFDVAADQIIKTIPNAHNDYIRSIQCLPNTDKQILSGSYDFYIKLFDMKSSENYPQMTFSHQYAVEDITIQPTGFSFVSVGGNQTTFWDIRTGKSYESINNNQKTVVCAHYLSTGDRLITGSLDQHLKIYRTDTISVAHQYKLESPILSFDITGDNQHLAIGMNNGKLIIKSNQSKDEDAEEDQEKEYDFLPTFLQQNQQFTNRIKNYRFFNRGIYTKPQTYDIKFDEGNNKKLGIYDQLLKKFQYKSAMITALQKKQNDIVASLGEELIQRGSLHLAFKNLDQEELKVVFEFILKKIKNPKFADLVLEISNIIFDEYQEQAAEYFEVMKEVVDEEINVQKNLISLEGQLETIINCNLLI